MRPKKPRDTNIALAREPYGFASKDYESWNRDPHLAGHRPVALLRFWRWSGSRSVKDEAGIYRKVASISASSRSGQTTSWRTCGIDQSVGFRFSVQVCDASMPWPGRSAKRPAKFMLSPDYYKGDRSMRESGFDVSFRFGPFGAATHHYAPICLNSLLYKTEKDLEEMSQLSGIRTTRKSGAACRREKRPDPAAIFGIRAGRLFFDFNFQTGQRSPTLRNDFLSAVGGAGHARTGAG